MGKFDDIVKYCRYLLNSSPAAEKYLEYVSSRISPTMQDSFAFGYFPGTSNLELLTSLVDESILRSLSLLYSINIQDAVSARDINVCFFEHHPLIFPYKDVYGNIVAIGGRTLLDDDRRKELKIDKYKYSLNFKKGNHVFGLYEAKEAILEKDCVYIVEGQFDVIKAREKGIYNIVAIGGSSMSDYQLSLICRYTKNLFLLLDNDQAGDKGREKIVQKFGQVANINNVYLPPGYKDIDEYLKQNDGPMQLSVRQVKYSL